MYNFEWNEDIFQEVNYYFVCFMCKRLEREKKQHMNFIRTVEIQQN